MALSNSERIYKALDHLRVGLSPFVLTQLQQKLGDRWNEDLKTVIRDLPTLDLREDGSIGDVALILKIMKVGFADFFQSVLGVGIRVFVFECADIRNRFAHQEVFSHDDTWRALDTIQRLLTAVGAGKEKDAVADLKESLFAVSMREKIRSVERKEKKEESPSFLGLLPWREVITPQKDVIEGTFKQAEFAADLDEVFRNRAKSEYQDPIEFFQRTYLTRGLKTILKAALLRLSKSGGDPVVELQTRFGGGKTHSMIALYHLARSSSELQALPGLEDLLQETGIQKLNKVNCAIITGNQYGPNQVYTMSDGTKVKTLWGLMAWQLGGVDGYQIIQGSDESATSPGKEELQELLQKFNPNLIMMDELVTYFRQLPEDQKLSGGTLDSAATFLQSLSEAVKNTPGSMMIASLPASEIEVGGTNGARVLERLQNVLRRVHVSWSPAAEDETYEIIRRRLFGALSSEGQARADSVIKKFVEHYREHQNQLPSDILQVDYRELMSRCYPIHPEVFDKLYKKWSSIDRFQQTRGVLRFMANVIHELWDSDDKSPLIMPGQIPFSEPKIRDNITGYMEDNWKPVLDSDVDGSNSTAKKIDNSFSQFGAYHLVRRIARTILLGSAPVQNNRGITFEEICLGTSIPPQKIPQIRDALSTLLQEATYLYKENDHHYFDTKASLNRTAQDMARNLRPEEVEFSILDLLQPKKQGSGFAAVQVLRPGTEVPDEMRLRLIILPPSAPHSRSAGPASELAAKILKFRGSTHREFQNCLVFLAADPGEVKDLYSLVSQRMAWKALLDQKNERDLTQSQSRMVELRLRELDSTIPPKILSTWCHILYPQPDQGTEMRFDSVKTRMGDSLESRTYLALKDEDLLAPALGFSILENEIYKNNLCRGESFIELSRLFRDYCSFPYLRRINSEETLLHSIDSYYRDPQNAEGVWVYASSRNHDGSFEGIKVQFGQGLSVRSLSGYLVKREAVHSAIETLLNPVQSMRHEPSNQETRPSTEFNQPSVQRMEPIPPKQEIQNPRNFRTSFDVKAEKLASLSRQIAEEILPHLLNDGADINIYIEIEARTPKGFSQETNRVVTENTKVLGAKTLEIV
ncbi:MAG: ATP-binding protein [Candidatus Cloacimonetes bacterium]|nr:ATP-binding protein [Candidatus Cloacimonadota bacterium]